MAAATLADRYINDRFLPDKAIDLIDEAGARMRIRRMTAPPDLREFDEKMAEARREKESLIDAQDFEKAASTARSGEARWWPSASSVEKQWRSGDLDVVAEVDDEQIAGGASATHGHPGVRSWTEEETHSAAAEWSPSCTKRIRASKKMPWPPSPKHIRRTRAGRRDLGARRARSILRLAPCPVSVRR